MKRVALILALFFAPHGAARPVFTDVTEQAGITFQHSYGDFKLSNIVEGTGAGVCTFDYDNDGWLDLYFVTGKWTKGVNDNRGRRLWKKLHNALYRNRGNGQFEEVTKKAGVDGKTIYSTGCSAADYDNDGDTDLYVLNYGPNILYRNNGDGTFKAVSRRAKLADDRWSLSAVWFDYDQDGFLDVYVANYLYYDDGKFRDFYAAKGYPGPLSYSGQADALYRNNGDGTFTDVTKKVGVLKPGGRAMSVSAGDLNNDGLMDIYVANDAMENYYFEQTGKGHFEEKGLRKGLAFSEHGQGVSSMGPVIGDVDGNGALDIFIPDMRYNTLLLQKNDFFVDQTRSAGISEIMGQYSGWAAMLFDYDHDGWLDLFTVHGHAHFEFVQEDTLLRNLGNGKFTDVSKKSGDFFARKYVGRGGTQLDFDNDGDLDLVIVNLNDRAILLRNEGGNQKNWLQVEPKLKFGQATRHAYGTRVTAGSQMAELIPMQGYLSQGQPRVHFGLESASKVEELKLRWPDGTEQALTNVRANQILEVVR